MKKQASSIVILIASWVLIAACSMSPSANQSGGAAATVYTAGQDSSGNACYWTGTSETSLQGGRAG